MLSNSLGTDLHMWDDQAAEFAKHFRLDPLRPPRPRQVRRAAGPLQLRPLRPRHPRHPRRAQDQEDQLVRPVDGRHGRPMAGRQCARPRREARPRQHQFLLRRQGAVGRPHQDSCARRALPRLSTPTWSAGSPRASVERAPQTIERMTEMFLASNLDGYIACVEAIRDMDFRASNPKHHDADAGHRRQAGPGDAARRRRSHRRSRSRAPSWPRSTPRIFPMSSSRKAFTEAVLEFPCRLRRASAMDEKERHENGMAQRRKVLGNEWVDRANAKKTRVQRKNSRTSSPAPPGAKSGRGRITTSAPAACW